MIPDDEPKDCGMTGYFSIPERKRIQECMKDLNLFKYSQFVRLAVLEKIEKMECE